MAAKTVRDEQRRKLRPAKAHAGEVSRAEGVRAVLERLGFGGSGRRSLRAKAIRGSLISLGAFGFGNLMTLVSNAILASLLTPAIFGVMALVRVSIQGLKMFSDVGIGPSIIQHHRGEEPSFLNTAWTIQVARGIALWLAATALAWPASKLYDVPELLYVLPAAAFSSVIAGLNSPMMFTLHRRMLLGWNAVVSLLSLFLGIIVMISLAWLTESVWALVAGAIASSSLVAVLSHTTIPQERARLMWDRDAARDLIRFGRWIFVSTALTFVAGQLDRLVLGRLLPIETFGVYALALTVVMFPGSVVASLASTVMLPALSAQARTSREALASTVEGARAVILPGGLCAILGVVTGAPILFGYVYDARYAAAGWICQALAIPAWFRLLEMSADRAVTAVGDSRSLAESNFVELLVTSCAALGGFALFGLSGFIGGMGIGAIAAHLVVVRALRRHGVDIVRQDLRFTGAAAVLGGTAVAVTRGLAPARLGTPHLLIHLGVACAIVLPVGVWSARRLIRETLGR